MANGERQLPNKLLLIRYVIAGSYPTFPLPGVKEESSYGVGVTSLLCSIGGDSDSGGGSCLGPS